MGQLFPCNSYSRSTLNKSNSFSYLSFYEVKEQIMIFRETGKIVVDSGVILKVLFFPILGYNFE